MRPGHEKSWDTTEKTRNTPAFQADAWSQADMWDCCCLILLRYLFICFYFIVLNLEGNTMQKKTEVTYCPVQQSSFRPGLCQFVFTIWKDNESWFCFICRLQQTKHKYGFLILNCCTRRTFSLMTRQRHILPWIIWSPWPTPSTYVFKPKLKTVMGQQLTWFYWFGSDVFTQWGAQSQREGGWGDVGVKLRHFTGREKKDIQSKQTHF